MTDLNININSDGYCEDCNRGLECLNCEVTYQLLQIKTRALDLLNKKLLNRKKRTYNNKEKKGEKLLPRCGCGGYINKGNMCDSCLTSAQVYGK